MKTEFKLKWDENRYSVEELVLTATDGSGYDMGQLEALDSSNRKIREVLGRLISRLYQSKKITEGDLEELLNLSIDTDYEETPEPEKIPISKPGAIERIKAYRLKTGCSLSKAAELERKGKLK